MKRAVHISLQGQLSLGISHCGEYITRMHPVPSMISGTEPRCFQRPFKVKKALFAQRQNGQVYAGPYQGMRQVSHAQSTPLKQHAC